MFIRQLRKDKNGVWYAKQQTKTSQGDRKIDLMILRLQYKNGGSSNQE